MIRLSRRVLPQSVLSNLQKWVKRYLHLLAANDPIPQTLLDRYKDPGVKPYLMLETCEKCAYCESKITHIYPGDVEHILPKAHYRHLRLEYTNLTIVCWRCNHEKGDYYDELCPLVNPYTDEPSDHLMAVGPLIMPKPANRRGRATELILKLNRTELVSRRIERIGALARLADEYAREPAGPLKDALKRELLKECGECTEFAFISRSFISGCCGIF